MDTQVPIRASELEASMLEPVAEGLTQPWSMAFLPEGGLLVTEKSGELLLIEGGNRRVIGGLPDIVSIGQGGLMDVVLHPGYEENGWIYISYVSPTGDQPGGNTAVLRGRLEEESLVDVEVLYKAGPNTEVGRHFGSRLAFDRGGYLFFSIGDRGARDENPQDITKDGGKVYRLHDDGRVPENNPFVGQAGSKEAIYSYGHRNPQGMALHPDTGKIWIHEHGPKGGDEINVIEAGKNYGWPLVTFGVNYSGTPITNKTASPHMEDPLFHWTPSIAPSGMAFVTSDRYPDWEGSLLVGSLKFAYLERLVLLDGEVVEREKLLDGAGRMRDVMQGPDGYIYVSIEGRGIFRILPM
ncbi:PQQ-dependent sugar dehydrogenase [Pelagicoccus sp. SDUM812002]|uniref:PQQ-dependent sugar dehydrogenase n=1 Tax=Pelagicoccus sp. SDUM812002 TaxID=3041266 RepID=UPI00280D2C37|nr:PQQ-dependent sugar dehydrogenase [Pelagicoccus sp. SDUM812002]MDQ8185781.1 PQQ-dependent sugar dehydrogenase [Pelagicoccus sp. SDUM812002]